MKEPGKLRNAAEHSKRAAPAALRIVLVRTQHPGNIGAAARAMKTMGMRDLVLVAPFRPPDEQSIAMASGAAAVVEQARTVATLPEALADCVHVAGVSARPRGISVAVRTPRAWTEARAPLAAHSPVALVFGSERTGLTNDELALCQELVQIPADPDYSSLNLAQAVQVLCYEARMALHTAPPPPRHVPADHDTMEGFYAHLEEVLVETGFLAPKKPRHLMRRLRRLFARAEPDAVEANILRGILTSIEKKSG